MPATGSPEAEAPGVCLDPGSRIQRCPPSGYGKGEHRPAELVPHVRRHQFAIVLPGVKLGSSTAEKIRPVRNATWASPERVKTRVLGLLLERETRVQGADACTRDQAMLG